MVVKHSLVNNNASTIVQASKKMLELDDINGAKQLIMGLEVNGQGARALPLLGLVQGANSQSSPSINFVALLDSDTYKLIESLPAEKHKRIAYAATKFTRNQNIDNLSLKVVSVDPVSGLMNNDYHLLDNISAKDILNMYADGNYSGKK